MTRHPNSQNFGETFHNHTAIYTLEITFKSSQAKAIPILDSPRYVCKKRHTSLFTRPIIKN